MRWEGDKFEFPYIRAGVLGSRGNKAKLPFRSRIRSKMPPRVSRSVFRLCSSAQLGRDCLEYQALFGIAILALRHGCQGTLHLLTLTPIAHYTRQRKIYILPTFVQIAHFSTSTSKTSEINMYKSRRQQICWGRLRGWPRAERRKTSYHWGMSSLLNIKGGSHVRSTSSIIRRDSELNSSLKFRFDLVWSPPGCLSIPFAG